MLLCEVASDNALCHETHGAQAQRISSYNCCEIVSLDGQGVRLNSQDSDDMLKIVQAKRYLQIYRNNPKHLSLCYIMAFPIQSACLGFLSLSKGLRQSQVRPGNRTVATIGGVRSIVCCYSVTILSTGFPSLFVLVTTTQNILGPETRLSGPVGTTVFGQNSEFQPSNMFFQPQKRQHFGRVKSSCSTARSLLAKKNVLLGSSNLFFWDGNMLFVHNVFALKFLVVRVPKKRVEYMSSI